MLNMTRRGFIGLSVAVGAGAIAGVPALAHAQPEKTYPFSAGSGKPRLKVPALACDCHHHIYDRAYPYVDDRNLPDASVADYLQLRSRLGLSRSVVIQPSSYGVDNRCLLAALAELGESSRGIAVVNNEVTDAELNALQAAGVRGIRFNFGAGSATSPDMIAPLSERIAPLGWHIEVHAGADALLALEPTFKDLPVQIVFDHFGRLPYPEPMLHAAYRMITDLLDRERAWVKVSGAYQESQRASSGYDDVRPLAQAFIKQAPERIVWGTDWPHPSLQTKQKPMPDDAALLDLLGDWVGDEVRLQQVLVENPARLYGF
ncbi:amidohydrolase family protein [Stutzerimonas stutzeri]